MPDAIHTHLTNKELFILKRLAKGQSYQQVAADPLVRKAGISLPMIHTLALSIRKKTGIGNTQDAQDCKQWLKRHPTGRILPRRESELSLEPTPTQQKIMFQFMHGIKIEKIARNLDMGRQTAVNHLSIGCRRAGVGGTGPYWKRIDAIMEWFERHPYRELAPTMDDPMFQ